MGQGGGEGREGGGRGRVGTIPGTKRVDAPHLFEGIQVCQVVWFPGVGFLLRQLIGARCRVAVLQEPTGNEAGIQRF